MERAQFEESIRNTILSFRNELETQLGFNKILLSETMVQLDRIEQFIYQNQNEINYGMDSFDLQDMAETLGL